MLVLSRKAGETITIDGYITVRVVRVSGNRVKIGIDAPNNVHVLRGEMGEWDGHELAWQGAPEPPQTDEQTDVDELDRRGSLALMAGTR